MHKHTTVLCILVCVAMFTPALAVAIDQEPDIEAAVARGVEILITRQEGPDRSQWPYEGVYRVSGDLPIGYRVGGTAIGLLAILHATDTQPEGEALEAAHRAVRFICASIEHDLMDHAFESRYDVRGWGYTYGLLGLLEAKRRDIVPEDCADELEATIRFFIDGIAATEIPQIGGWNYARQAGFSEPGRPSPFMTAPTLQALFTAHALQYEFDTGMVERGLRTLELARTPSGSYVYAGVNGARSRESVPGSVGRMLIAESTLYLAGRTQLRDVRAAIDAFLVHWDWLDQRRAQTGTHVRPYGIAPYYFYFAHHAAAQAIELLPQHERAEYRRRLYERIFHVQIDDGSWNDRVFERSANYGTSMVILALRMSDIPMCPNWEAEDTSPTETTDNDGAG